MKLLTQFSALINNFKQIECINSTCKIEKDNKIIGVLLEEYKNLSAEIMKRVELQQGILRLYLVLFAAIVAALTHLLTTENPNYNVITFFLLFACFPFYFLSWSFTNHDFMICTAARYLNIKVCPQIKSFLCCDSIFTWEDFLTQERNWKTYKFPKNVIYGEENLLPIIIPLMLVLLSLIPICNDIKNIIVSNDYYLHYNICLIDDPLIRFILLIIAKFILLYVNVLMITSAVKMNRKVRTKYREINTTP